MFVVFFVYLIDTEFLAFPIMSLGYFFMMWLRIYSFPLNTIFIMEVNLFYQKCREVALQ